MKKLCNKIRDWWYGLDSFSQFWLFWFGVATIGVPVAYLVSLLFGGGE